MTDRTHYTQRCELENSSATAMHVGCRSINYKTNSTWPFRLMVATALSSKLVLLSISQVDVGSTYPAHNGYRTAFAVLPNCFI
jgi:hypothetical protein